jgi:hypothetical protein
MGSRRSDLWKTPEGAHRDAYQLDDPARAPDAIETAAATAEPDQRRHPAPNLPFALTTGVPAVLTPSHDRTETSGRPNHGRYVGSWVANVYAGSAPTHSPDESQSNE